VSRKWKRIIIATCCVVAVAQCWAQAPQFATLDIEWENGVSYANNLSDLVIDWLVGNRRSRMCSPRTTANSVNRRARTRRDHHENRRRIK
jgi:hypothetical protein